MKHYVPGVVRTLAIALIAITLVALSGASASEPLYVSGIEDLLSQGIVTSGTGTRDDPYLIENLIIAGTAGDYGLVMENIDAYVVISNCEISDVVCPQTQGALVIRGCSNVTVRNCNVHNNEVGIRVSHCTNVSLLDNRITGNRLGLRIDLLSRDNTIIGNLFDNDTNAWACCSNGWNNNDRGNFWSDFPKGQDFRLTVYPISPGNEDHMPARCDEWSSGEWHPPVAPEHKEPTAVKPTVGMDTIPPVIKLEGQTEVHLAAGECFADPGWKATDNCDGDISSRITVDGISSLDVSTPGLYTIGYTVEDNAGNRASAQRTVIVGWPEPIKAGELTAVLDSLETRGGPASATIRLAYQNGLPPDDLQLQIAHIVYILTLTVSHFTDAAVLHLSITDSGGELAEIQIDLDDSAAITDKISTPLCLFRSLKVFSFRKGDWLDFTQPPHTSEEAQQLVELALDTPELSEFSVDARATSIMTLDGNASFRIQLSDKLVADKDGFFTSLDSIRDASGTMQFLTALAIEGSWREIHVALSADFYGLLYKNILASSAVLDEAIQQGDLQASDMAQHWNEVFVHPVLAAP